MFSNIKNTLLSGLCLILIIFIITYAGFAQSSEEPLMPFYPGEKLTYELRWGIIPAGKAILEVLPVKTIDGIKAYHFSITAETNSFIDNFYKVRDKIDAYTDLNMTKTILYHKKQREGSRKRDIKVNFNWENNTAQYSNFGKPREPISIMPGTFDPLSALYYTRAADFEDNIIIERPITDGKKNVMGRVNIVKREKIKVGDMYYDTYLLEPELKHVKGVFEKSKNAKIQVWVSADEYRIPVKIKSKVVVGSFVGEIISATKKDS